MPLPFPGLADLPGEGLPGRGADRLAVDDRGHLDRVTHRPVLPPVNFDNDTIAILEQRMIQRIATGFWTQAGGRGFERLRNPIGQAKTAAELRLDDSDWFEDD